MVSDPDISVLLAQQVNNHDYDTLMRHDYRHDQSGNVIEQQDTGGTTTYGYDPLSRLTQATYAYGGEDKYTYDSVHNRITDSSAPGEWKYNENNQLITQGTDTTWSYDKNGQAVERKTGAGTRTYLYNPENRLEEVKDNGATIARYQYDPFGRRIKKEVTKDGKTTITWYLYADEGLITELDETGNIQTQYGWTPDGLWGTAPLFKLDKDKDTKKNTLYAYHHDQLGTPKILTDLNISIYETGFVTRMASAWKLAFRTELMEIGMFRLVGRSKIVALVILLLIICTARLLVSTSKKICLGRDYMLTSVTPTIQMVTNRSGFRGEKSPIIRGKIEFLSVDGRFIVGYLSVRFFKEDDLVGLEGVNDKEGFFLIDKVGEKLTSGMHGGQFFEVMDKLYGIKDFNFQKPEHVSPLGECESG